MQPVAEISIAPLHKSNIGDVVEVIRRSKKELPFERAPTVEEFTAWTVDDSEFRPDGSWVVSAGGRPVAFAVAMVEASRLSAGLDDAHLELDVVPEARDSGIGERLIGLASEYTLSRGVGKLRTRSIASEAWRLGLLAREGFSESYRVFFLVRRGRASIPDVPVPEGVRLVRRPYKECGDEEMTRIVEAFNDTFMDHFNFAPEPPERFIRFRDSSEDPECFSLAMDGDVIAGLSLSHEDRLYNLENGTKWGWINLLGVRPPYRNRGIGRFLLLDGMKWVLEQGMDTTYIGVYAKNEKALGMYTSVGFAKDRESMWLEKRLR
jgi:GNAT superfamily N-acetyltransferase